MDHIDDSAVEVTKQDFIGTLGLAVARELGGVLCRRFCQCGVSLADHRNEFGIQQIEAVSQIDDRTDDCGRGDLWFGRVAPMPGMIHGPHRTVFPEVDALAKPIVGVSARREGMLAGKNRLGDGLIAAVKPEHKGRKRGIHDQRYLFASAVPFLLRIPALIRNFRRVGVPFPGSSQFARGFQVFLDNLIDALQHERAPSRIIDTIAQ